MQPDYLYKAVVIDVVDGDTIDAAVDLGFHVSMVIRFRLYGIDTAELKSKDAAERVRAFEAKLKVSEMLSGQNVLLKTYKTDKYGRWLAEVYMQDGTCINQYLLENNLAVPYK